MTDCTITVAVAVANSQLYSESLTEPARYDLLPCNTKCAQWETMCISVCVCAVRHVCLCASWKCCCHSWDIIPGGRQQFLDVGQNSMHMRLVPCAACASRAALNCRMQQDLIMAEIEALNRGDMGKTLCELPEQRMVVRFLFRAI